MSSSSTPPPLIPRRHFFAAAQHYNPTVSPDGLRLAYLAPHQGRLNIWVGTLGKDDDKPLTAYQDHSVRWYHWRWDNQGLVFIRDEGGNERWRLHEVGLRDEPRNITPDKVERIANFSLPKAFPSEALLQMRVVKESDYYLFRLNLNSGQLTPVGNMPGQIWADNAGRVRIAARGLYGMEFQSKRKPEGAWQHWFDLKVDETFEDIEGFSADDQSAFVSATFGDDTSGLWKVNLEDGKRQRLAWDPKFDFASALFDPVTHEPELVSFMQQRLQWQALTEQAKLDLKRLQAARPGDIRVLSRDAQARRWTVAYSTGSAPEFYSLYDRQDGSVTPLFPSNAELENASLAELTAVSFTARDGMLLYGYLSLPPKGFGEPLPLIVLPHGGPWHRDIWGFDPEAQWLCNRGYAVLQVNFRGSTGFGRRYLNAGNQEWGGKMSDDLVDGKRWAVAQGIADPARCGIYGASYGGYAALAALAFTPKEFTCGVDICGPSSLLTLFEGWRRSYGTTYLDRRVGRLDWQQNFLRSRSPLNSAGKIESPLFIAQGKNDPRVPQRESDQMVEALKRRGKKYEYVLFDDEGHGFDKWENQLALNEKVEVFLAQHLGGRVESAEFGTTKGVDDDKLYGENLKVNEAAAAMGKTSAYLAMADRYYEGNGVEKNIKTSFEWCLKAAEAGDVRGMIRVGQSYGAGEGSEPNLPLAKVWFLKAARTGDPWAEYMLGWANRNGFYGMDDLQQARRWFNTALMDKNGRAGWDLARMQSQGIGGPVDEAAALLSLSRGAKAGDDWSKRELGRLAVRGKAGDIDLKLAHLYLTQAGRTDWWADFYHALLHENSEGKLRDLPKAAKLIGKHVGEPGSWSWSGKPARIGVAPKEVVLDGSLVSFQHVTPVVINGADADHTPFGPIKAPEFLWSAWHMMRDAENFYAGIDVRQGRPPVNRRVPGLKLWEGDNVELSISARSALATRKRGFRSPFDFLFVLSPVSADGKPGFECAQDVRGVRVFSKLNSTGYTLVVAVPLQELDGMDWQSGSMTRFEAAVRKVDPTTKVHIKAFWNGKDDMSHDRPDLWGMALVE